ncbi:uncharacterized protein LOC112494973 [Cephus cinctus]|uniref:Uncharacterized protein LOC112494973 n=1 Tax=Cephus cinctus TaxID=211228 RepID=A0AAJ7RQ21_CEPCN|nr:uncharacterized protein LOC112494973 [Cephus cinctus]
MLQDAASDIFRMVLPTSKIFYKLAIVPYLQLKNQIEFFQLFLFELTLYFLFEQNYMITDQCIYRFIKRYSVRNKINGRIKPHEIEKMNSQVTVPGFITILLLLTHVFCNEHDKQFHIATHVWTLNDKLMNTIISNKDLQRKINLCV